MASRLLHECLSPDTMNTAWRKLKSDHTPWSVTVSRDELQLNFIYHMLSCREALLTGQYRPAPVRQFTVPKSDGKKRVISAQYLQDKFIQRCLLTVLEPRAETLFHNDSFGYRPGRGVQMALAKSKERINTGLEWLVDADIQQFFDSIPHKLLIKHLDGFIRDKALMHLVRLWLKAGTHQSSILGTSRGIAQGAVLSPLFCNVYLHYLDEQLTKANIPFVRFADDFLLFTSTKPQAEKALAFAEKTLSQLGLRIHKEKTQVVRSGRHVSFLGESLPSPKP